jgi:hypothetical protein
MGKFRLQFTLRTVFIVSFLFAIVCSLVKCELVARHNFESVVGEIYKSLAIIDKEVDSDLYDDWLEETKDNPTFPLFLKRLPSVKSGIHYVIDKNQSCQIRAVEYFGSTQDWIIIRHILSPKTDYSQLPWEKDIGAINLTIKCYRPCSIISRQTSISIMAHPALKNQLLLKRLKIEFDTAGLSYNIVEN